MKNLREFIVKFGILGEKIHAFFLNSLNFCFFCQIFSLNLQKFNPFRQIFSQKFKLTQIFKRIKPCE